MPYPTTIILLAIIAGVFALGLQGTIQSDVVTTIYGAIVSGVLVGHYVKTSPSNGGTTTKTETPDGVVTTTHEPPATPSERDSL